MYMNISNKRPKNIIKNLTWGGRRVPLYLTKSHQGGGGWGYCTREKRYKKVLPVPKWQTSAMMCFQYIVSQVPILSNSATETKGLFSKKPHVINGRPISKAGALLFTLPSLIINIPKDDKKTYNNLMFLLQRISEQNQFCNEPANQAHNKRRRKNIKLTRC